MRLVWISENSEMIIKHPYPTAMIPPMKIASAIMKRSGNCFFCNHLFIFNLHIFYESFRCLPGQAVFLAKVQDDLIGIIHLAQGINNKR